MKVGSASGNSVRFTVAGLPFLIMFFVCSILFNGMLFAQEVPDKDTPATESPATDTPVADASKEVKTTETASEDATVDEEAKLEAVLKKNNKCLMCHKRDRTKTLEDGDELSLQVHKEDYLSSAHGQNTCTSCHQAIGNRKHPSKSTNISISSKRDYAVEMNESCRSCHREKYTQYEGSVHYAMVIQGSEKAPLCTSCHTAHSVKSMDEYAPDTGFPCKNCHESIYNAYTASVHGQARLNGNTIRDSSIQSPACSDCHKSHEVTALAIGDVLRTTCINCHENVPLLHNQWLPNAGTHLDIVSCAVCHAPFARRKFDLHLYDNVAQVPVAQKEGEEPIAEQLQAIVEADTGGDPLEIWKERGGFNQQGQPLDISLRSRMEVMSGVAAHQIASKSFAVRTCDSCHEQATRLTQNITVSITQPDGRTQSFETDRQVLSTVTAVQSISEFYALGGNPNKILDYMLILSLLAGFAIPIGHFMMGRLIRNAKPRGEQ